MEDYKINNVGDTLSETGNKILNIPKKVDDIITDSNTYKIVANPLYINDVGAYFLKPLIYKIGMPFPHKQDDLSDKKIGPLGNPIVCNLKFNASDITASIFAPNNTKKFETIELDDILLTVSQNKIITETQIQNGTSGIGGVVEYIGLSDYEINITGKLVNKYGVYDIDKVKQLKNYLNTPKEINVICWYLQMLGITDIVIKSYNLPQAEGEYSTQYFTIEAVSYTASRINNIVNEKFK